MEARHEIAGRLEVLFGKDFGGDHDGALEAHGGDGEKGWRVALRWRMQGTHTGFGNYGEPTGQRINILGISHMLIQDERIQQEWMLFDEFALLKQIHRPQDPGS